MITHAPGDPTLQQASPRGVGVGTECVAARRPLTSVPVEFLAKDVVSACRTLTGGSIGGRFCATDYWRC
jgi:hypothetical protein